MRDVLIVGLVLLGAIAAVRQAWIGVMLWTWLSIMNPHRYTYGFAFDAPVAMMAFCATVLGLLVTRDRASPFKAPVVVVFLVFIVWICISTVLGLDPSGDYWQWNKVMKVDLMILVALVLLHSKKHILALAWVCAGSLALLGAKGGLFTLLTGGNFRVWGPPGSFIEDNNEFALSLVMAIPLLRFLQLQLNSRWGRHGMTAMSVLCAIAAVGSYSRGALLAISAMAAFMWWNGKNKLVVGMVLALVAPLLIAFACPPSVNMSKTNPPWAVSLPGGMPGTSLSTTLRVWVLTRPGRSCLRCIHPTRMQFMRPTAFTSRCWATTVSLACSCSCPFG